MAFCLVYIQKLAHLPEKRRVQPRQPFGQVLMYRGLGDAEMLCGAAYRGFVFYDEHCQIAGALLNICIQMHHSLLTTLVNVYEQGRGDMKKHRA